MTYGSCTRCGNALIPIWFEEREIKITKGALIETGRKRTACSHLECPVCSRKESVDDTFDGRWHD